VGDENCSCLAYIIVFEVGVENCYNVGQTGTVFNTHFKDYNVGQTGTVFITHFKDLW
jgi:hypothetical protein